MKILGIISMVLFAFCYIPQIVTLLREKTAAGVSLLLWIMSVTAYSTGMVYVISLGAPILILTYSIGLTLSSTILILVIYYKAKEKVGRGSVGVRC